MLGLCIKCSHWRISSSSKRQPINRKKTTMVQTKGKHWVFRSCLAQLMTHLWRKSCHPTPHWMIYYGLKLNFLYTHIKHPTHLSLNSASISKLKTIECGQYRKRRRIRQIEKKTLRRTSAIVPPWNIQHDKYNPHSTYITQHINCTFIYLFKLNGLE